MIGYSIIYINKILEFLRGFFICIESLNFDNKLDINNMGNISKTYTENPVTKTIQYYIDNNFIGVIEYQIYNNLVDLQFIEDIEFPEEIIKKYHTGVVLNRIQLDKNYRNLGIGTQILFEFLQEFKKFDLVVLQLSSTAGTLQEKNFFNKNVLPKFYSKFGFKKNTKIKSRTIGIKTTSYWIKFNK